jgi:hypothetical protein
MPTNPSGDVTIFDHVSCVRIGMGGCTSSRCSRPNSGGLRPEVFETSSGCSDSSECAHGI